MTTVSIRIDDNEKKELDKMVDAMGMNLSTFYQIYTKKVLRDRRIPFEIEAPDPFYSDKNIAQIDKAEAQVKTGNIVVKSIDELEAMANE